MGIPKLAREGFSVYIRGRVMNRKSWYRKKYEQEMILSRHQTPGPFPYVLVLDHLKAGFNVPKIIRSASAFGCREIHFVGIPMFDPSPARGTLKQVLSRSFETIGESFLALESESYTILAMDPDGPLTLGREPLPAKCAFVMGHEEYGFSFRWDEYPQVKRLRIPQFGRVQSLNVSVAASLACYEYVRTHDADPEVLARHLAAQLPHVAPDLDDPLDA